MVDGFQKCNFKQVTLISVLYLCVCIYMETFAFRNNFPIQVNSIQTYITFIYTVMPAAIAY